MNFSQIKTAVILMLMLAGILSGCGAAAEKEGAAPSETFHLEEPSLPLELLRDKYLFEDIPAPENAQVYALTEGFSEGRKIYAFSFENFTLDEARAYISLLESSLVTREFYDEYYENEIPMLNYTGYVNDDVSVTLSQCGGSGGMTINVKSE